MSSRNLLHFLVHPGPSLVQIFSCALSSQNVTYIFFPQSVHVYLHQTTSSIIIICPMKFNTINYYFNASPSDGVTRKKKTRVFTCQSICATLGRLCRPLISDTNPFPTSLWFSSVTYNILSSVRTVIITHEIASR